MDLSQLTEFQRDALGKALDGLEQPPPDALPAGEKFWRGKQAAVIVKAATEETSVKRPPALTSPTGVVVRKTGSTTAPSERISPHRTTEDSCISAREGA